MRRGHQQLSRRSPSRQHKRAYRQTAATSRSRRASLLVRGQDTIVDRRRAVLVWEPGKKVPVYAFPGEDVALVSGPAAPSVSCLYKGFASYRDVLLDGRRHRGLFWSYQAPFREVAAVKGYLAPYNERVDLIVDGHPQERPAGPLGAPAEPSTPAA
jgi:uncharacterized protein (DUF427 family)